MTALQLDHTLPQLRYAQHFQIEKIRICVQTYLCYYIEILFEGGRAVDVGTRSHTFACGAQMLNPPHYLGSKTFHHTHLDWSSMSMEFDLDLM